MKTFILSTEDPSNLQRAADILLAGELAAFPTDTVYGLGASLENPHAIEKLFLVKSRENTKAIAVLINELNDLYKISSGPNEMSRRLAEHFWPGPLTLVVSRSPNLPPILSPLPTIGIRMPDHPIALQLLKLSGPLAVTSANLSGGSNSSTAMDVYIQLNGYIPIILDGGETPGGQPSTVVDCLGNQPVIIRQGPISLDDLLEALT